jgi:long-chain acyl-CoA synthetase
MNIASLLYRSGRSAGSHPAVFEGTSRVCDYAELARRSAAMARHFQDTLGLRPGARVGLAMTNCAAYLESLFACWWAGLAAVPMNAKLHPRELAYMIEDCGAALVLATPALADAIAPLVEGAEGLRAIIGTGSPDYRRLSSSEAMDPVETATDDLAWLFYTSGTTGRPKGAMLSHGNLMAMTLCYTADVDSVSPDGCLLHAAPMSHGSGLYSLPHVAQAAAQVIPESGGFDPAEVLGLLRAHREVSAFFAPTMVRRLVAAAESSAADTANLKTIVYGGGPMYVADLKHALAVLGPKLVQIYGQGETQMTITSLTRAMHADVGHPRYEARLASVGRAMISVELRIADEHGRAVSPGTVGEVLVRGPSVMLGYWRNPEATARTLRDGWLWAGDLGALDEDGFLTLKDRSKDLIISGGANIYPREVEEVLLQHAGVGECSVIGRPHPDWGEEVVAFVVASAAEPASVEALDTLCLDRLARFKRPKHYRFVDELPKNNYGKVLKAALRETLEAEDRDA